jgi:hypothetical protein
MHYFNNFDLHIADSLSVEMMSNLKIDEIVSFDSDLNRANSIIRVHKKAKHARRLRKTIENYWNSDKLLFHFARPNSGFFPIIYR